MSNFLLSDYQFRINKSIDYIESNQGNVITLDELASVANFSKFHFSRIFQSIIGETPFQFILRIRLEKAASLIISNRSKSISEIAIRCGFSDISIFSRNFKRYYKVSASDYKKRSLYNRNKSQQESNNEQDMKKPASYFCPEHKSNKYSESMKLNKSVEIVELPKITVAYVRNIGPYNGDQEMFQGLRDKILTWAEAGGWTRHEDFRFLVIYHDDPTAAISENLRMSVCVTVPDGTKVNNGIGKMEIEAGTYVIVRFSLNGDEFQDAWNWLYGEWMPNSGYEPDDKPYFEMYCAPPQDGNYLIDFCVPVRKI